MRSSNTVISDLKAAILGRDPLKKIVAKYEAERGESASFRCMADSVAAYRDALAEFLVAKIDIDKMISSPDFNFDSISEQLQNQFMMIMVMSMQ